MNVFMKGGPRIVVNQNQMTGKQLLIMMTVAYPMTLYTYRYMKYDGVVTIKFVSLL